jgi:hypothetical protein
VYISVETGQSLDRMSHPVPHIPNPSFWKKYYTDQAKGKTYARANPKHRTVQESKKTPSHMGQGENIVVKTISPVQQIYDRAQSQIERRLQEVGGASKRKRIKGNGKKKTVSYTRRFSRVKRCHK